ncbi:TRAP transporter large permease [Candidimonas sp. SYP-B2681]|uniref:TRAP transporter large permease n=1 Tax=Candidimonas sp. SYP-B2681 TaxID=2497686 RepID=UPI000F86672F|nr:TRAP transporter large permease [Candidimonas sp. SYP-B2681]RTZ44407.1 TRAP transporter large permease [Candidimonas sp. SYP-B2681]
MLLNALMLLLGMLALAIPVAAAMGILGLVLDQLYSMLPLYRASGEVFWSTSTDFLLVSIPMFILLGELMLRAGMAERLYDAMEKWLGWLPGGLMHANIGACATFAATSGSSVATAATIGTVAIPQGERHGYSQPLFLGTLAAGGTLGILIPPSINMIIYGTLTDTSVPQLYLAGFIPGLVMACIFSLTVAIACFFKPAWGGVRQTSTWGARVASLVNLVPPLLIFLVVVGSIYAGIATPTEAAAVGVMSALGLAALYKSLSWTMLREAAESTIRTASMVILIVLAAYFLNFVLVGIGLTDMLTSTILSLGWTPMQTFMAVVLFYLVLGCFLETLSMMVTTIPITAPLMISMGFDPVWYGIVVMVLLEMALITPPVGLNLFVVQGVRRGGSLNDVILGSIPFVIAMIFMVVLLALVPGMATWLPQQFY